MTTSKSSTVQALPAAAPEPASFDSAALSVADTQSDAPLVDLALASIGERPFRVGASTSPAEEISALRAEVGRLSESAAEIGSASLRIATAQAANLLEDARGRISDRPLAAVGVAALTGFILGLIRAR
ncbi:hypothetical protein PMI07_006617 [Rhizobium sp. CF080]|uniref:hypothetical protein n=1 Tax=Rhizobium sp. (strain CF080) TaxID=1144310 RepID=UPI0002715E78|nr:hypothetical protein [Rhizobium sp. CF080]EUB98303.1 hypothetical protein PMI07_006617 [Rhizobium sp. CF080]